MTRDFDFASLLIQWLTLCYFPCHPPCICWGWKQDNWTTYSLFLDCFDQYLLFVPQKTRTLFVVLGRSEVQTLFILPKVSSPSSYLLFCFLNNQFFDEKILLNYREAIVVVTLFESTELGNHSNWPFCITTNSSIITHTS